MTACFIPPLRPDRPANPAAPWLTEGENCDFRLFSLLKAGYKPREYRLLPQAAFDNVHAFP
jgi:hypothetical protein